jgi:transposase
MGAEFSPVSLCRLTCRGMPRNVSRRESPPMLLPLAGGSGTVVKLGELMMILELHRQGLTVSAIARQLGLDRKTVRRYIARGLEPPAYGPRPPQQRSTDPFLLYLRERLAAYPGLTAVRLWRELRERGYAGGYTAVKHTVREIRPEPVKPFEVRFETPPGVQAQVDLAHFEVVFTDEPGVTRIVWLFSLVLGFSRLIWARFVVHQDLQTILRCHMAALEAIGGAPQEILYDRMKTAVIGEDADGLVVYNRGLLDLARHYGFQPRACRPYRPKTKGKVERPFRYIREDFFLGGSFRNLDDLNAQLRHWLDTVANPRVHATTQRVVNEAFAEEKPALKSLPLTPYRTVLGNFARPKLGRFQGPLTPDLIFRRKMPPGCSANVLDNLIRRFLRRYGFLSHLRSSKGYDEPEILPSSTHPICLMSADGGQSEAGHSRRCRPRRRCGRSPSISGPLPCGPVCAVKA